MTIATDKPVGRGGFHFKNWAGTYSSQPQLYFEPETEDEIRQIILTASANGKTVKVVGCGHSASDLACTKDYMISLNKFNKVIQVDEEHRQITVQGGCRIDELNEKILPQHGLALSVQAVVSDLTLAGAISTGTHGSGLNYSITSDYVVQLQLMTATGEVLTISKEENGDLYKAAVLSLGSLGVILTITYQCEKAFRLFRKKNPDDLYTALDNVDILCNRSDHFRFTLFPYTDCVMLVHYFRTNDNAKRLKLKPTGFIDTFLSYYLLEFLLYISTFIPRLVRYINRLYYIVACGAPLVVDRSDRLFTFPIPFKHYVMEWALPRENLGSMLEELNDWIYTSNFPAHPAIDVRFVKQDDIYLSPCYKQDSAYINIVMHQPYNKAVDYKEYWNKYQEIAARHDGRPHWAKDHSYTAREFSKIYPKWQEFCDIRSRLDPNGLFLNDNLKRVFGVD